MTRARAGGTGKEAFGHRSRALVIHGIDWQGLRNGTWWGVRPRKKRGEQFDTWAEALAYALGEDKA